MPFCLPQCARTIPDADVQKQWRKSGMLGRDVSHVSPSLRASVARVGRLSQVRDGHLLKQQSHLHPVDGQRHEMPLQDVVPVKPLDATTWANGCVELRTTSTPGLAGRRVGESEHSTSVKVQHEEILQLRLYAPMFQSWLQGSFCNTAQTSHNYLPRAPTCFAVPDTSGSSPPGPARRKGSAGRSSACGLSSPGGRRCWCLEGVRHASSGHAYH